MTNNPGFREFLTETNNAKEKKHSSACDEATSNVLERIAVMRRRELGLYQYARYRVHVLKSTTGTRGRTDTEGAEGKSRFQATTHGIQIRNGPLREAICEWCYGVVDRLCLSRETVATTVLLLDRYLATVPKTKSLSPRTVHLTAFVILHISIKTHEMGRVNVADLATLAKEQPFSDMREFALMEAEVLFGLRWYLHPPTAASFVRELVFLLLPRAACGQATANSPSSAAQGIDAETDDIDRGLREDVYERAIYLTELAVCDSFFMEHDSATVAVAAILNVLDNHTNGAQKEDHLDAPKYPSTSAVQHRREEPSLPTADAFRTHVETVLLMSCEAQSVVDTRSRLQDIFEANLRTSVTQDEYQASASGRDDIPRPDKVCVHHPSPPPDHADRVRGQAVARVAAAPVPKCAPRELSAGADTVTVSHPKESRKKHHRKSHSVTLGVLDGHRSPDCIVAAVSYSSSPHPPVEETSNGRMTW